MNAVFMCPRCGSKASCWDSYMPARMRCSCIPGGFMMVLTKAVRYVDCGDFRLTIADEGLRTVDRTW